MVKLIEGDIEFDFSKALTARHFHDDQHGLSHCMKAVDFIVELPDRIYFIEVKDPGHPEARPKNSKDFVRKMRSKKLIKESLTPKARDSYLYELAMGNISKPVYYIVLIELKSLSAAELSTQTDLLKKDIPVDGPPGNHWPNKFIHNCAIMNLNKWNSALSIFPASRIGEGARK